LNCLLDRYDVRGKISKEERAFLALQVESDIGIAAGLMDRVIQVYGGCVHMNFRNVEKVKETGIGEYTYVDCDKIPKLFIVWSQNPSNSGKIHQPVRQKWLNGDSEIIQGMKTAADCAREGLQIMEMSSGKESCAIRLAPILSANFAARRKMFTDAGLGDENIRMIEVCQSVGAGAKFTGSGGAIVACCPDGIEQEMRLQTAVEEAGFSFAEVEINSTREE
jgi:glucuronokinase